MELKYQNQALKDGQHGQILNETSNKTKINKEIEVLEKFNIELEHSVAKLLAENEKLHKENEHLKQTYKDLYDSIKKTRVKTKDHNDSLIAQINNARLSKFEADFKQQQSKMTNKIDSVLKAITDRIAGALRSDTVKNLKLNTTLVLSARSYPIIDPQCSSHPSNSINAIKVHFKEATISQTSMRQPKIETEPQQTEEPKPILEDEFQDLHLNLPVLEVLAHAPIYNAILDKYVENLELGKNGSAFVQREIPAKMEDPELFTLPCRLWDSKPFNTLADLGSCVTIIPLYLFKKLNNGLLEETDHIFGLVDGTKSYPVGIVKDVEVRIGKLKLLNDFYVIDMKKDLETPFLVGEDS
ncbi:MAK10-like protein [Tanacetum coccineum]